MPPPAVPQSIKVDTDSIHQWSTNGSKLAKTAIDQLEAAIAGGELLRSDVTKFTKGMTSADCWWEKIREHNPKSTAGAAVKARAAVGYLHAWNRAQPNPQPCPTTHASPLPPPPIAQEVLDRATEALRGGGPMELAGRPPSELTQLTQALTAAAEASIQRLPPAAPAVVPSPPTVPEGMALVDSKELLGMQLDKAKAEERAKVLKEGAPTKEGCIQVSFACRPPHVLAALPLPGHPPPPPH